MLVYLLNTKYVVVEPSMYHLAVANGMNVLVHSDAWTLVARRFCLRQFLSPYPGPALAGVGSNAGSRCGAPLSSGVIMSSCYDLFDEDIFTKNYMTGFFKVF